MTLQLTTVTGDDLAERMAAAAAIVGEAECVRVRADPAIFYPVRQNLGATPRDSRPDPYAAARQICACCPVREPCADLGELVSYGYGMWGGLDPAERRQRAARRWDAR